MQVGVLEDEVVRLEPLRLEHVGPLLTAATEDRATFGLAPVPGDRAGMQAYVEAALDDARARRAAPFAIVRKDRGVVAGATRLMNLEWWTWPRGPILVVGEPRRRDAGDPPDVAEIGHVWLAASAQRTAINTAACVLLMRHAFETWVVHRLVLKTDARNQRSRDAIGRLGGVFEGVLRAHQPAADGIIRDTAMFSITRTEWPAVQARLGLVPGGGPA
ncbi:MAG: GNAT family N-acetyltransferase [Kofleriaceae bacterium]|nr:GNAT family N-acetyltransferase [Myxococcales bacterium]MCB9565294.1 GNAT family N-acetyltransferase [Kofleriaceae bacterium]